MASVFATEEQQVPVGSARDVNGPGKGDTDEIEEKIERIEDTGIPADELSEFGCGHEQGGEEGADLLAIRPLDAGQAKEIIGDEGKGQIGSVAVHGDFQRSAIAAADQEEQDADRNGDQITRFILDSHGYLPE